MACSICLKTKAGLECGLCNNSVCKTCAQFLEEDSFSFLEKVPEELTCSAYCPHCFADQVTPQLDAYQKTMELAKDVNIFLINQTKESRIYNSDHDPITIEGCPDRDEAILRLAFKASKLGFNGLIKVDVYAKKVREGGYQNSLWCGIGIPTHIKNEKSLRK